MKKISNLSSAVTVIHHLAFIIVVLVFFGLQTRPNMIYAWFSNLIDEGMFDLINVVVSSFSGLFIIAYFLASAFDFTKKTFFEKKLYTGIFYVFKDETSKSPIDRSKETFLVSINYVLGKLKVRIWKDDNAKYIDDVRILTTDDKKEVVHAVYPNNNKTIMIIVEYSHIEQAVTTNQRMLFVDVDAMHKEQYFFRIHPKNLKGKMLTSRINELTINSNEVQSELENCYKAYQQG